MNSTNFSASQGKILFWLLFFPSMVGLYFTTRVNYLLFHTLVELFSIVVAACVFTLTWKSIKYIKNPYLILVGLSYLFVGMLDLIHTLAYKGMPIFVDGGNYATQLWIAARYFESIILLTSFIFLLGKKEVKPWILFLCNLIVTGLIIASVLWWKVFPECFVPGAGLTGFKVTSEYLICAILLVALIFLVRHKKAFAEPVYRCLLISIFFTIVSELAFTFYIDAYGLSNLVGHYFKLFSFMMVYKAVVSTGIEEPYDLIFKELNETNIALQEEIRLRKEVEKALMEKEDKLVASYHELQAQSEELQAQSEELQAQSDELHTQNVKLALAWDASRRSEEALKKMNEELDKRVEERTQELREKDHVLMQQSRLAAMGDMINNIAHQWRQPLNALGLLVQQVPFFCEEGCADEDFLKDNSKKCMELIQHMSHTIEDFRNFFKPNREKVFFKVNDEIAKTLSLMEGSLQGIHVGIEVDAKEDPVVLGFPSEFSQVLINILVNARDALKERQVELPKVRITVDKEDDKAVVTIVDNAGGVPEDIMGNIFSPYFTTKDPEVGTGVGLFMSKTIIEKNMGGHLTVRNLADGAEFRIVV